MPDPVVILGLGFTTQRLARNLRKRDVPVYARVRNPERFAEFEALGVQLTNPPQGAILVHTIPPVPEPDRTLLRDVVRELHPCRLLYISSTGVYGAQTEITADTSASPDNETGRARLDEEAYLAALPNCSTLILRSAAIYGPGRGVQVRLQEGKWPRGSGGVVSRIHVDDLAAILEAGIHSNLEGAWPVADDLPAATEEVMEWCANLLHITPTAPPTLTFPVAGRHVDGSAIRERLEVSLRYRTYKTGIPASL